MPTPVNTLEALRVEYDLLTTELQKPGLPTHRRQALRRSQEVAWLRYRNAQLVREVEQVRADALSSALQEKVQQAETQRRLAQQGIRDASIAMERSLRRLADRLQVLRTAERYDDLIYELLHSADHASGLSSPTSVACFKSELAQSELLLELANPTE